MSTLLHKRNSTLSVFAAFLLFFSSEKYASSVFSFFSESFHLQDTTITQIDSIRHFVIGDLFVFCTDTQNTISDSDHEHLTANFLSRTLCQNKHSIIARLVLQYRQLFYHNSFTQFRLDIKRSNLPAYPA